MDRPVTTLFMLMSVDGKISTGANDVLDVDKDFPKIPGVSEGLYQYCEIEQTTDLWSLNSGRVQAKIGVNTAKMPEKSPVSFVIIDNTHLKDHGVRYFCGLSKEFVLITSNKNHPAFQVEESNLHKVKSGLSHNKRGRGSALPHSLSCGLCSSTKEALTWENLGLYTVGKGGNTRQKGFYNDSKHILTFLGDMIK